MRRHMITPAMTNYNDPRAAIVDAQERASTQRSLAAITAVLAVLAVILAAAWIWRFHLELGLG
jgi:hypothetical protein